MSQPSSILRQLFEGVVPKLARQELPPGSALAPEPDASAGETPAEESGGPVAGDVEAESAAQDLSAAHMDAREPAPRSSAVLSTHLKILADSAPVAMAIFDRDMRYLYANHRWIEVFRLERTELVGRTQFEVFPSLHPGWRHVYERALGGQVVCSDRDTLSQSGRPVLYRWEVRPWRNVDATIGGVMITCVCVPGVRSRDLTAGVVESSAPAVQPDAASVWDLPVPLLALDASGRVCRAGAVAGAMFLPAGLQEGETFFWQLFGERGEGGPIQSASIRILNGLAATDNEFPSTVHTAGSSGNGSIPEFWHFSRVNGSAIGAPGAAALVIGVPGTSESGASPSALTVTSAAGELQELREAVRGLTERDQRAQARETRLRTILDVAPCGLIVIDERGRPVFHNQRADALMGSPPVAGGSMEDWISAGCRDDLQRAEVVRLWRESIWRKQTSRIITFAGSDGLLKDIELRPAGLPGGGMVLLVQDVTDENRAEEVLRATEAKFRALVHENPLPVVMTDRSGAVFEANAAAESLLGRTRAELRRMTLDQWIAPGGLSERASALREMAHRGDLSANVNVEVRHREGRTIPAALRVAIVPDAQGMPAAAVQFFRPLEAPSKTTFTGLAEEPAPPVSKPLPPPGTVLLATDSQGRVSEWSSAAEECFGVSQEGAIGRGLHTFFRPSDATGFYQELSQLKPEGSPGGVERDYFHPVNGRTRGRFDILPREEGSLSVVIESHPVSEEPQPEPKAAPSASAAGAAASAEARPTPSDLARERLLLGETHHRVKNHLQIITSMLNLQLSTMNDQSAREALRSSQNRVRSVAALHQHLYSLAVGEAGTFTEFATGLIRQLRECYEVAEDRVALELDIPGQPVPEEWLMPLALSLNEMVSNAFKHAYPDGRGGRMKVALKWDHEHVELLVQDDGIGLPPDFDDHRSSGLGLKILRVFAGQLGGEIVVSSEPDKGAAFRLRFPLGTGEG